jgi:DNA invertase Pin-like site-specific DNA recombinase
VSGLRKRGIGFTSPHEALDTTTPGGRLVFHVFAALAEFIRELIMQGTNGGLDAARARGPSPARQSRCMCRSPGYRRTSRTSNVNSAARSSSAG